MFEGKTLKLIDTHAHLDELLNIESAVDRARKSGIVGIIAVGINQISNIKIIELSIKYKDYVFPAIGIHPSELEGNSEEMIKYVGQNADSCVAIGEIGLDYWLKEDKEKQKKTFKSLLEIALNNNKPVSIHSRGAWEETYNIVEYMNIKKAVFHWYSGPLEVLKKILAKGYYISASPSSEYSKKHRESIYQTPLENLLLETDCPVKYKGIESEPIDVLKTLHYVSELKGVEKEVIAKKTTENAIELFKLEI